MQAAGGAGATYRRVYGRLEWLALVAHLAGASLTFLYFQVIDPTPTGPSAVTQVSPADALAFVAMMVVLLAVGRLDLRRVQRRLDLWSGAETVSAERVETARREALAYVPRFTAAVALQWVLAAAFWLVRLSLLGSDSALRVFIGVLGVGGVVTTALVFTASDLLWREVMPLYFPDGRLGVAAGARQRVLARLLLAFLVVGVWPLAIMAYLTLGRAREIALATSPDAVIANLTLLVLFVLVVEVIASTAMALCVSYGITNPLGSLQAAMARIEHGDLAARAEVTTNDELGYLSERFNGMAEGLERAQQLRTLFGMYVSPQVAERALERGVELGGDVVPCTVLFSDMRDFTGLSEQLPAAELIGLLNRYMGRMVGAIAAHGGILNKFGGDSLLAVFGTPLNPAEDHAARAIGAALAMRQALAEFNVEEASLRAPSVHIGIGIATGPVVAGNVGSRDRLEYTVIGDTVNLAARLQEKCKELGVDSLIAAETYRQAATTLDIQAVPLPPMPIRGKREPVTAYHLAANPAPALATDASSMT